MALALAVTANLFALAALGPWSERIANAGMLRRLAVALGATAFVLLPLLVCIARLARHRFFSAEDIDGGGLGNASREAAVLQAILQNTLEQTVLAAGSYLAWAAVMPASTLAVIPAACMLFLAGRLAFTRGYRSGAPSRAFGFALTFYPSAIMLITILAFAAVATLDHIT